MKTIIVPLDGSALAEQVLPYVQLYAPLLEAQVVLLRAVTDEELRAYLFWHAAELNDDPLHGGDVPREGRALAALTERAAAYLEAQAAPLRAAGLQVTTEAPVSEPAEGIVAAAQRHPEALIMLATHGYSGLKRWTLGSTADKVVHSTSAPVFLVRAGVTAPQPLALRRILVPLDGSALAEQALPVAIELARRAKAELVLLRAVLPFTEFAPALAPLARPIPVPGEAIDEEYEQARKQLQLVAEQIARPELTITWVTELGYPAEVILAEASAHQVDLIVMATHGRSGIQRWVLGSVADKVLHAAHTPLLLVRAHGEQG
ncbi:MAG TPA: universal stress protein [Roseiflexaceae bacterium]|nr:universal stress protein [Roseiflexaceae bacterium]